MAVKLAEQVVVIFILLGIGIILRKKGIVSEEAARQFSNFALVVITPVLIVEAFQRDFNKELLTLMGGSAVMIAVFHLLASVLGIPLLPRRGDGHERIDRLCAACSNCGFMGIPLMTAALGEVGMLYAVVYIWVFNLYLWSYGVFILGGGKAVSWKKILLSPGVIAGTLGVALFLLRIRLPEVVLSAMKFISGMNTPLPMIITGVFIADISLKETLCDWHVYWAGAVRLVVAPLLFLGILWVIRAPRWFPGADTAALAVMISCSCPAAISCMMMPAKFGGDAVYGSKLIVVSTLLSVVTIPAVASLSQLLLSH